jgi:hypothetical protein
MAALAWTALLAAGCASGVRPAHEVGLIGHVSAVPWVDRPAPAYVAPVPPKPVAAYPPCRARQLAGRPGRGGPAAGTVFQEVRLTNRSRLACTLAGWPQAVTGTPVAGGPMTQRRAGDGFDLEGPGPANLRPGQSGWVTLAYADGCAAITAGGKADYQTLFIALDGGRVRVSFPAALNLVCGLEVSKFGAPQPAPPSTRSPLNALTAAIAAPAAFIAGAPASYTVTLVNRTGAPVGLTPCPSYAEFLGVSTGPGGPGAVLRRYYLNCAAVQAIPAHRSITFVIRTPVPGIAGMAKLDWQLQGTNVTSATGVLIRAR